jgi:hypothetical protein
LALFADETVQAYIDESDDGLYRVSTVVPSDGPRVKKYTNKGDAMPKVVVSHHVVDVMVIRASTDAQRGRMIDDQV